MKLTNVEYEQVLCANRFSDLSNSVRLWLPANFEEMLNKEHQFGNIDPSIICLTESLESSLLVLDLECLLIAVIPMSAAAAGITVGSSLVILGVLLAILYYQKCQKSQQERGELLEALLFSLVQEQASRQKLQHRQGYVDRVDSNYASKLIAHSVSPPPIRRKNLQKIAKVAAPVAVVATGIVLTAGWAVPAILTAVGVAATAVSMATPAGFAVLGVVTVCLAGYAIYKIYQRYQAKQRYDALIEDLARSKESHLTLFDDSGKNKPSERVMNRFGYQRVS